MAHQQTAITANTARKGDRTFPDFRELHAAQIVATAERLAKRIEERFPESGLLKVASEVTTIASEAMVRSQAIRRPAFVLRGIVLLLIISMIVLLVLVGLNLKINSELFEWEHFIQTLEAGLGSIVFIGAAMVYLISLERRWKRDRALRAVRELRALAHIVDMHQLTKDPESTLRGGARTASSPKRTLTTFQLGRYLDYCSELLSLISKIGAIYIQHFPDESALESVDQLAALTNGLSRNIWQKIMLLEQVIANDEAKSEANRSSTVNAPPTESPASSSSETRQNQAANEPGHRGDRSVT